MTHGLKKVHLKYVKLVLSHSLPTRLPRILPLTYTRKRNKFHLNTDIHRSTRRQRFEIYSCLKVHSSLNSKFHLNTDIHRTTRRQRSEVCSCLKVHSSLSSKFHLNTTPVRDIMRQARKQTPSTGLRHHSYNFCLN